MIEILENIKELLSNFIGTVSDFFDMIGTSIQGIDNIKTWITTITSSFSMYTVIYNVVTAMVACAVTFIAVDIIRDLM